jgi:PAS domain S-box-containing protein
MDLSDYVLERVREDTDFVLYRAKPSPGIMPILVLAANVQAGEESRVGRLAHELALFKDLDPDWAVKPLSMVREEGRMLLALRDPGGQPLDVILAGKPMELKRFLETAVGIAASVRQLHASGLIHKDIKPANVFVGVDGDVRLTGFGFASRHPRERQAPSPPEVMEGTLEYMAPEQTGRINRSVDSRSDLYALGITLYEMIVGVLPFSASDAIEWIHCHIARQPPPPSVRVEGIPPQLDAIILKLLAKNAEDRYQTAAGVQHDLRRCLAQLREPGHIEPFPVAECDEPERLRIPEKLYGREEATNALSEAYQRVAEGRFEVVLVSGYSGVGKSAAVEELLRSLHLTNGLFASGKVDQYKRDIPYSTLAEAFQRLLRHILSQDDAGLDSWRAAIVKAIGANGQLMSDLFPNLALILRDPPRLPIVPEEEAKTRLHAVFRRFLSVFATPEHPFALFIDDLQWLDIANIELLKWLIAEGGLPHFLLIVAYRSNEVESSPGLAGLLSTIRATIDAPTDVTLAALTSGQVKCMIAETLHAEAESVAPLADLVFKKTQGNPFFVVQFLTTLNAEGLLHFDLSAGAWRWDLERIRSKGITDNVAELLAGKLARFDEADLRLIRQLACLGNSAPTPTLSKLLGVSGDEVESRMRPFVGADLIHLSERQHVFAHDRVYEAAYALIPNEQRAQAHLDVGRAILASVSADALYDDVFEIANQFNRGALLIDSSAERHKLAELNLIAGKRAKSAAAYESALIYLAAGCALLPPDPWEDNYRLAFDLHFHQAECKFLIGEITFAEEHFAELSRLSTNLSDLALVVGRQLSLYPYLGRAHRATEVCVDCLARMDVHLPLNPTSELVNEEYRRLLERIGSRKIIALVELPAMRDARWREVMELLRGLAGPAGLVNVNLLALLAARMGNISLEHGLSDDSSIAFAWIGGLLSGWRVGTFEEGRQFGELSLSLTDEHGLDRHAGRVYQIVGSLIQPYKRPLRDTHAIQLRATEVSAERGGFVFTGYAWSSLVGAMIDCGTSLGVALERVEEGLAFARKRQMALAIEFLIPPRLLIRALRGLTTDLSFNDGEFNEEEHERHLESTPLAYANIRYRVRKLQLHFYAGEFAKCVAVASSLDGKIMGAPHWESRVELPYFSALARAALVTDAASQEGIAQLTEIKSTHAYLQEWASRCPENFAGRARLLGAEIARLENRELDAQRLYYEAIQLSRDQGFVQNEGIANECTARFYERRGFGVIADAYLRNAKSCYARWGANGKVRQLVQLHPELGDSDKATFRTAMTFARDLSLERFDLSVVVAMHQAVSRELVLDKVVERLITIATEYAGAVRGLLLLHRGGALGIVAEASTNRQEVSVNLRPQLRLYGRLPQSILNYVIHTQEATIVGDALESHPTDEYVRETRARAILCVPLVKQGHLVGVLYLENNFSPHIFTKDRLLALQLLASQAAISIENAELLLSAQSSQEASRRISEELRQSFDTMPALAWRASAGGILEFSNKQWHDFTGIAPDDARSGSWIRAFHPDDIEKVSDKWRYLLEFGTSGEFEARMRRSDGEYRSFLIRVTPMRSERGELLKWHGTHTDIENLKRAEHAQEALARVARITALGELTVSIGHEINQPLMAIVTNAATCLRWLDANEPNVAEARLAAERIIRDGHRAGDIITSIRALARKAPPSPKELDLNALITEVLSLTLNELNRHEITTETEFAKDAESVLGDRTQLQQVMLNLIINGVEAIVAAAHERRSLKIRSQLGDAGSVLVTVADTGIGLAAADSERIFEVFYTTKRDGMGIGLSICRSIVEAHGGRLWATPNEPCGTVFHLTLQQFVPGCNH